MGSKAAKEGDESIMERFNKISNIAITGKLEKETVLDSTFEW